MDLCEETSESWDCVAVQRRNRVQSDERGLSRIFRVVQFSFACQSYPSLSAYFLHFRVVFQHKGHASTAPRDEECCREAI